MADISILSINSNDYNIKDATARTDLLSKIGYADYRTHEETPPNSLTVTKHYLYFYASDRDAPIQSATAPSNYLCRIDAEPFLKDGMVSNVTYSSGTLTISFNTDSGKQDITLSIGDVFSLSDYYTKSEVNALIPTVPTIADNLTTDDATKVLSAKQGKVLQDNKAEKSELSITAVTGHSDKKNIQLKSGTSQEVLIAHQDISGKADKSSTVTDVSYDTTNKKLQKTINGSTSDVVTAATIVTDGGGITDVSDKADVSTTVTNVSYDTSSKKIQKTINGTTSDVVTLATVATSGSYADLSNKPTIPDAQIQSDWSQTTDTAKDYIKNKPTNVSAFTNDAGYQTSSQVSSAISGAVYGAYASSTETLSLTLPAFTTT